MKWHISSWFFSICLLHALVITKSNFQKSADEFQQKIDQLIFENWILQLLNHVNVNLKPHFLIKGGHYIVPSPSTASIQSKNIVYCCQLMGVPERFHTNAVALKNKMREKNKSQDDT